MCPFVGPEDDLDPPVGGGAALEQRPHVRRGRRVVGDAQLPVRIRLRHHRVDGLGQPLLRRVVDRQHDRDQRLAGEAAGVGGEGRQRLGRMAVVNIDPVLVGRELLLAGIAVDVQAHGEKPVPRALLVAGFQHQVGVALPQLHVDLEAAIFGQRVLPQHGQHIHALEAVEAGVGASVDDRADRPQRAVGDGHAPAANAQGTRREAPRVGVVDAEAEFGRLRMEVGRAEAELHLGGDGKVIVRHPEGRNRPAVPGIDQFAPQETQWRGGPPGERRLYLANLLLPLKDPVFLLAHRLAQEIAQEITQARQFPPGLLPQGQGAGAGLRELVAGLRELDLELRAGQFEGRWRAGGWRRAPGAVRLAPRVPFRGLRARRGRAIQPRRPAVAGRAEPRRRPGGTARPRRRGRRAEAWRSAGAAAGRADRHRRTGWAPRRSSRCAGRRRARGRRIPASPSVLVARSKCLCAKASAPRPSLSASPASAKTRPQASAISSGVPVRRNRASRPSSISAARLVAGRTTGRPMARNSGSLEGSR